MSNTYDINSNRWISIVGYIASLFTIIQTIIYCILLYNGDKKSEFWQVIVYQSATVACVISLCILLINSQIKNAKLINEKREYEILNENKVKELNGVIDEKDKIIERKVLSIQQCSFLSHNINHQLRQINGDLYSKLFYEEEETAIDLESLKFKFRSFLQNYTTNIKSLFDQMTGDNSCSVYISILSSEQNDKYSVSTYYRDSLSYRLRTNIDLKNPTYGTDLFTPFKEVLIGKNGGNFFICNDCKSYNNFCDRNDDWLQYYNACLTVPIRLRMDKNKDHHVILGFVTVDNHKGGFDNDAKELLCSFADLLFTPFNMLIDLGSENDNI